MDDRRRPRRLILWPLLAVVAAYLAGILVGGLLLAVLSANAASDEGWTGLGNFLLSLFVGLCVAVISWVTGLVWVARRLFDPGNRAGVIASSVGAVVATAVIARVVIGLAVGVGAPPVVSALGLQAVLLLVLAVPSVVFRLWARRVAPEPGWHPGVGAPWGPVAPPGGGAVAVPTPVLGPTEWHPEG